MTIEDAFEYIDCALSGGCHQICNDKYRGDCKDDDVIKAKETIRKALKKADKYKWHDLRKNPDDLPEYHKNVLFATSDGNVQEGCRRKYEWIQYRWSAKRDYTDVIAWREIEPFEEDEE